MDAKQTGRQVTRSVARGLLLGAALALSLSGCAKPQASGQTSAKPAGQSAGQRGGAQDQFKTVLYKGVPAILKLKWGAKTAATHAEMKRQGWKHLLTRRSATSSIEVYSGRLEGRPAQAVLTHQAKTGLVRVQVILTPQRDIDIEYRTFIDLFEAGFGRATSLFTPRNTGDNSYRLAAAQTMYPITGWVFKNGFAASVAVRQPWKLQGDTRTAIVLSIESPIWRSAYRLNQ